MTRPQVPVADVDPRSFRRAVVVAYGLFVLLGLPDGALGPIWPDLRDHFGRTDSSFGILLLFSAGGYAVSSAAAGHLTARVGLAPTMRASTTVAATGFAIIAIGSTWEIVMIGFLVVGVGWGVTDSAVNAWMAITRGPREMGLLHASYGVGAFAGPLLATAFVAEGGAWRGPYVVVVGLTLAAVAATTVAGRGFQEARPTTEVSAAELDSRTGTRVMGLLIAWFAVYVGVEVAVAQWAFTLLTEARGQGEVEAGVLVATFWGGFTVGRFILAAAGPLVDPERLLAGSMVAAAAGTAALWVDPAGFGGHALPFVGLALSVTFPLAVGRTAAYLGAERAGRAVGYQMAAASVGAIALPALVGVLADRHGVGVAPPVSLAGVVVMAGLWRLVRSAARVGS